jgi:hypothetical protein
MNFSFCERLASAVRSSKRKTRVGGVNIGIQPGPDAWAPNQPHSFLVLARLQKKNTRFNACTNQFNVRTNRFNVCIKIGIYANRQF